MSDHLTNEVTPEIDSLLRFYRGRKMISVFDIREHSRIYKAVSVAMNKPPSEYLVEKPE